MQDSSQNRSVVVQETSGTRKTVKRTEKTDTSKERKSSMEIRITKEENYPIKSPIKGKPKITKIQSS